MDTRPPASSLPFAGGPAAPATRTSQIWLWLVSVPLLAFLAGSASASTPRGSGLRLDLPAGFRPVPAHIARREAGSLVDLLRHAGLHAVSTLRARQDRLGESHSPEATFTAARVRVLTNSLDSPPELAQAGLHAALLHASARSLEPKLFEPRPRSVAGRAGFELGWSQALAAGRTQWHRFLLLPGRAEVLVLSLSAVGEDPAPWESIWTQASQSFAPEAAPVSSGSPLWPALPLTFAAAALATALIRRRRPPPPAPSARHDALRHRRTPSPFRDGLRAQPAYTPFLAAGSPPLPSAVRARPDATLPARPAASTAAVNAADGRDLLAFINPPGEDGGMSLLELKLARQNASKPSS